MGSTRFIIITVPPPETCREIDTLRKVFADRAGCISALRYPPHVTLRTGAVVPDALVHEFITEFRPYAEHWEPFWIKTEAFLFDTYKQDGKTHYFAGYTLVRDEPIKELNRQLLSYTKYKKSRRTSFLPHLTIAFDDLSNQACTELKIYYQKHPQELPRGFRWLCDNVALYVQDDGGWVPFRIFRFSPSGIVQELNYETD